MILSGNSLPRISPMTLCERALGNHRALILISRRNLGSAARAAESRLAASVERAAAGILSVFGGYVVFPVWGTSSTDCVSERVSAATAPNFAAAAGPRLR